MEAHQVGNAYQDFVTILQNTCERVGRSSSVSLVAVSKKKPPPFLQSAYDAGCRDFGESYAQEFVEKSEALPKEIRWHFVGHLQTNKAKLVAKKAYMVHSVDSLRLGKALYKSVPEDSVLQILVQVNIAKETQKSGVLPEQALDLTQKLSQLGKNIRVMGFMTIPPMENDPEKNRPYFASLRTLRDQAQETLGISLPELSMGMTSDATIAIEEGATLVRVGTAIFGKRMV